MYKSEYLIRCRSRCTDFASLPPCAWRNCCATWWALATHHSHHCDAMAVGLFRSTMISQQIVNIANKSLRHYNNSNNKKNNKHNSNNKCMCLFVSHSRHQQHDRQHQMWQRYRQQQQQQPAAATQSQRWLQHTNSICCIIVGGGCNVAQDLSHCFTVRLSVRPSVWLSVRFCCFPCNFLHTHFFATFFHCCCCCCIASKLTARTGTTNTSTSAASTLPLQVRFVHIWVRACCCCWLVGLLLVVLSHCRECSELLPFVA